LPSLFSCCLEKHGTRHSIKPYWWSGAAMIYLWVITISAIVLLSPSPVVAKTCKIDQQPARVKINVDYGKTKYNNGHSALQISTKFGRHKSRLTENIGLTRSSFKWELSYRVSSIQLKKRRYCTALTNLTLNVGYDQFRVYIARRFKPGSCVYRTTLNHENTHVRISQSTLRKYIPKFKRKLRQLASQYSPIETSSPASALNKIKTEIRRGFEPVVEKMHREIKQAHGKIDTPENYRREQNLCPPTRR
jgi:hypothetical protein